MIAGFFAFAWDLTYPPDGLAGSILAISWFVILAPLCFTFGVEVAAMEGILRRQHKAVKEAKRARMVADAIVDRLLEDGLVRRR